MKVLVLLTIIVKITTTTYDNRIITTLRYSKYHVVPTIVNGEPASLGQMPYLVSIKEPTRSMGSGRTMWESLCGATIITKNNVLSAAHCFEGNSFYYKRQYHMLRLVAGNIMSTLTHSGVTETNKETQWRKVKKLYIHKYFAFPENDIALINVDEPWEFTFYVNYATPASMNLDYSKNCYSTGFGTTSHTPLATIAPVLLKARIDIMPRSTCSRFWEMDMRTYICTGSAVTDVGVGDSGGPLACRFTSDPAEDPDRDLLVGVVSGKNFDKTTLFTRVSQFRDWIDNPSSTGFKLKSRLFLITFLILKYPLFHCKVF